MWEPSAAAPACAGPWGGRQRAEAGALCAQVAEVCYAKVQGCNGCIEHFKNAKFACLDADCLPLVFVPAVRGARCAQPVLLPCSVSLRSLLCCPLQLAPESGRHRCLLAVAKPLLLAPALRCSKPGAGCARGAAAGDGGVAAAAAARVSAGLARAVSAPAAGRASALRERARPHQMLQRPARDCIPWQAPFVLDRRRRQGLGRLLGVPAYACPPAQSWA